MRGSGSSPIARRLTRINMIASGTALVLAGAAFMAYDFVSFRDSILGDRSVEAQIVASNTLTALTFDDADAAARTLGALEAEAHIEGAALYRLTGEQFATYQRSPSIAPLVLPAGAAAVTGEWHAFEGLRSLRTVRRIVLDGMPIGFVYIRSDHQELPQVRSVPRALPGPVLQLVPDDQVDVPARDGLAQRLALVLALHLGAVLGP